MRVEITEKDFDVASLTEEVKNSMSGAVVTFIGTVRDDGMKALEYEAYSEMAAKQLRKIGEDAVKRFRLNDAVIVHRTGRLEIGENVVFIAVSAPHRADAFDGCRYIIDEIKEVVPIWKKGI